MFALVAVTSGHIHVKDYVQAVQYSMGVIYLHQKIIEFSQQSTTEQHRPSPGNRRKFLVSNMRKLHSLANCNAVDCLYQAK